MKKLVLTAVLTFSCWAATNISQFVSAQAVSVNNSTSTTIKNNLSNATTIQMYIRSSGTSQIFTLTLPNGTTVEVPSGGVLTLRFATNLQSNDTIGTVVTATNTQTLQVLSIREVKQ